MLIQQFISRSFQIPSAPAGPEDFPWVLLLKCFQPLRIRYWMIARTSRAKDNSMLNVWIRSGFFK